MYSKLEQQKGSDENIEFVEEKVGGGEKKENNRKNEIVISTNILCQEGSRSKQQKVCWSLKRMIFRGCNPRLNV